VKERGRDQFGGSILCELVEEGIWVRGVGLMIT